MALPSPAIAHAAERVARRGHRGVPAALRRARRPGRCQRWTGGGSRYHVRIETITPDDAQDYVLAAVHRDDSVRCGHVGVAFDETRDLIARAFADAGYTVSLVRLGNSQSATHCDGTRNAGDGTAAVIDLVGR